MKLQWIRENWTPSEAANAQEWVIEAVSPNTFLNPTKLTLML